MRKARPQRSLRSSNSLSCKRSIWMNQLAATAVANLPWAKSFKLSELPNYAEFTNLFEYYKINAVKLQFFPRAVDYANQTNSNMIIATDRNDATVPTSGEDLMQYNGRRIITGFKPFTVYIKAPRVADAVYNGALSTGYAQGKRSWIDSKSPSVDHYGLKGFWYCDPNSNLKIDVMQTFYLQFKSVY